MLLRACHHAARHPTLRTRPLATKINYNPDPFGVVQETDVQFYPTVTSNDLKSSHTPPREVRMLVRDFIEDSLYNPHYGYFAKHAVILPTPLFNFRSLRNMNEFESRFAEHYAVAGDMQVWHTPSALFRPWYGRALARAIVSKYLPQHFPYADLVVYELGGGNGSLGTDVLEYIRKVFPKVYERTRYTVVEISERLAELQRTALQEHIAAGAAKVVHKSIFEWDHTDPGPCVVLACEVADNLAHDLVRYDSHTAEPVQTYVAVDGDGDFTTHHTPLTDRLLRDFFRTRSKLDHGPPLSRSPWMRSLRANLPFAPNLTDSEYVPTRLFSLLRRLREKFPQHRLLLSDFSSLPDAVEGANGPVVQTRLNGVPVPCTTPFVAQGHFDIFFPTDFTRLADMYDALSLGGHSGFFTSRAPRANATVFGHREFLELHADVENTQLRNGENPMLDSYKNVRVLW